MITFYLDIYFFLIFSSIEPKPLEVSINSGVPSSWSLLETILGLLELIHMLLFTLHLKSLRLLNTNLLIQEVI